MFFLQTFLRKLFLVDTYDTLVVIVVVYHLAESRKNDNTDK